MKVISRLKDKVKRHQERHTPLGYRFVIADSIRFLNANDWQTVASQGSIFLGTGYLETIEAYSPENTQQRYVIAYDNDKPVVVIACQIAEISGTNFTRTDNRIKNKVAENFRERILVCGNLVSSGLHGIAFDKNVAEQDGWRIVAEALYKIRRGEQLNGTIDFVMIKDIKGDYLETSEIVERYSYRRIKTDPDMILTLPEDVNTFDAYLALLTSKYRARVKKIKKAIESEGYRCEKLQLTEALDTKLHQLYLNVENKSNTRLATLPKGYFLGMARNLQENFNCYGITSDEHLAGFVTVIKDGNQAIAYYVGVDYEANGRMPVYFRLLQLVIECALEMGCRTISFGRTALEPKANLGAKPVEAYVWARHRVPVVNYFIRQLFRNVPYDEAPERNVTKR
ncbi:GNAT family N-acetyltransferase [Aliikangiella coralliicola]|uniref:GNAT family N-acetyltransferase n=1 Tax=Aliikangiella coralliicola TaxID=2592383 RepID=A0A545U7L6_9GAMM|nr:GNAT family N-acetyltransferase [Aliikangiella coralliicola]TQV85462.1 GNAT family N-acetyltransferase [Aliikangiella coralliicola]